MSEATSKAPPVGLRPRFIVAELRAREIVAAMERYAEAKKPIPEEWREELNELNEWLADRGYETFAGVRSWSTKATA